MNNLKIYCILFGFIITITFICEYFYYYRIIIPFEYIAPYITWRVYDLQKIYENTNKTDFKIRLKEKLKRNKYLLMENDYPYYVNAKHYILWTRDYLDVNEVVYKYFNKSCKFKWFENPRLYKSIPDIIHYHIFTRLKGCKDNIINDKDYKKAIQWSTSE